MRDENTTDCKEKILVNRKLEARKVNFSDFRLILNELKLIFDQ